MQIRDGGGFGTMMRNAQKKLPEGHRWTETKSISMDGLRVWNRSKVEGYKEAVDENGKVITKEVKLNRATKDNITGKPTDYAPLKVEESKVDQTIQEVKDRYPGIEVTAEKQANGKFEIKLELPV